MTITVNGPNGVSINFPEGTDAATIQSVMDQAIGHAPAKQEMVGFGERGQREQDMPETPELRHDVNVAKRMAAYRDQIGPGSMLQEGFALGLGDEAKAAGAAVGGMLRGNNPVDTYNEDVEARRNIKKEYTDKSTLGSAAEIAGNVLAGAPAAGYAGATTLLGKMGEGALAAGSLGAIQGFGYGEGAQDSAIGALVGGGVGAALGGGAPAVISGIGKVAAPITNTYRAVTQTEKEAARRIGRALEKDAGVGKGLNDTAYSAAIADGQPVALMDRGGENTRRLARSAADQSGEAEQAMSNVIDPRYATQSERIRNTLGRESTLGMNADDAMDAAKEAAKRANAPAYRKAYDLGDKPIWDETLEGLAQTPAVQTALKKAVAEWRNKAALDPWMRGQRMFNPPISLDEAGNLVFQSGGLPSYPNLRLWDYAKQELDDMASAAARGGKKGEAKVMGDLVKELRNHLDSLDEIGKAYKIARAGAAAQFGEENAYAAGKAFATQTGKARMDARQAIKAMSKFKPEERKLFREGYIQAAQAKLKEVGNTRDATLSVIQSDGALERARVALGKDGVQRLQAQVEVEKAMDELRKAVQGGSKTNRFQQEVILASAAGGATGLAGGDKTDITVAGLAAGLSKHGQRLASEKLSKTIGRMLASKDPKQVEALTKLATKSPKFLEGIRAFRLSLAGAGAGAIAARQGE